uniref:C2H2-type domain-containing protein n=1 Tax=Eptatretus burgeri TaxID=7764 RepID=A0A8C4R6D7_EPTBU
MSPLEAGCLPVTTSSTSQGTSDDTLVIREPCQTSLSADEGQEKDVENWLSSYNNAVLKCNTRSKGNSQNSCDENKSNHCPVRKSQYKCHVYKKVFPHHSHLTAHKVVQPDVKHYKCPVCEKDFAHSSQLDMHKIVHASKKPKQYKCSVCQKAFLHSTYLKTHQKIHSEENTFRCSICDQIFSTSSHLQKHKVTHAGGNICDVSVCKKAFSSSSYLKEDEVDHTGEQTSNCSYCKKSSDVIWLNGDDTIPIDEKTFNCSVCKSPFSSSSSLHMDRKDCSSAKTFRCYVCKMVFSSCFYLSNHKNSHEQNFFDSPFCKKTSNSSCFKKDEVVPTNANTFNCSFD